VPPDSPAYQRNMDEFYEQMAAKIAEFLERGLDVSVIVAGDPLLYSSFLPIYQRLGKHYETIIIPGIISAIASAACVGLPLCQGNECFTILSGLLPEDELRKQLAQNGTLAILKLGPKNFDKIRRCLAASGRDARAIYIEAASLENQKIMALADVKAQDVPYFSLILVGA